jgi:hypothetical protein
MKTTTLSNQPRQSRPGARPAAHRGSLARHRDVSAFEVNLRPIQPFNLRAPQPRDAPIVRNGINVAGASASKSVISSGLNISTSSFFVFQTGTASISSQSNGEYFWSLPYFEPDPAILHLAAVPLEADRTALRHFHRILQNLTVAEAKRGSIFHGYFDFIPITLAIMLQLFVWAGERIIATLQLRTANEYPAISIGRSAELEPQDKIPADILFGRKLLNPAALWRSGDDQSPIAGDKSAIRTAGLSGEVYVVGHNRPDRCIRFARLLFYRFLLRG